MPKELVDFLTVVLKGVTLAACGRRPLRLACAGPVASVNPNTIALCHAGPTTEPEDAQHILEHPAREVRLCGASGMERPPTEVAITESMRRFKRIARASTTAS